MNKMLACAAVTAASFGSSVYASDVETLAGKFGARKSVGSIGLSPQGGKVVIVTASGGGESAVVLDFATSKGTPILGAKGGDEHISHCQFVLEDRVVCEVIFLRGSNRQAEGRTKLVSIAADGSDMKVLSAQASANSYYDSAFGGQLIDYMAEGEPGSVLMTRWYAPDNRTGTITGRSSEGLGVDRVNVTTLARKMVEMPFISASDYISDGHGRVRVRETQKINSAGHSVDSIEFQARPKDGRGWVGLSSVKLDAGLAYGFQPVAVDSNANVAYGFDDFKGFSALYQQSLDGGSPRVLLAHDGVDIDGLVRIGPRQRVVGASYATEKRVVEYFDPELKALAPALGAALGGKPVAIVDSTIDEGKLLLFAGSDVDPGRYYLFDKETKKLGEVLPARPELAGMVLGSMKAITFPAADGTQIPAYLTLPPGSAGKNLPAIVMPHGGPAARDEWGFDWLVQFFAARGYAVLQPNYRGSSGYGAAWFQKNGFRSWETAIGDINSAGKWLVSSGISSPEKLAIVGWSYGGYAALQSAVVDPGLFKAIVAIAPVTDLDRLREEARGQTNYRLVESFIGTGAHVDAGSPARHADRFQAPVLLIHGDADMNVAVGKSRLMEERLKAAGKQVNYIEFPGLAHNLDDALARKRLLEESDKLIRQALAIQ